MRLYVAAYGMTVDRLLAAAAQPAAGADEDALAETTEFLRALLANGPRSALAVQAAAQEQGVSERALRRAKKALGVVVSRVGFGRDGVWHWALPPRLDNSA